MEPDLVRGVPEYRYLLFGHILGIRDTVFRDQARTMLQEEPLKDGSLRGDNRRTKKAAME
jgi:hypothetical protein